jgi:methylenetetrahydrofolate reductase (NADPH)
MRIASLFQPGRTLFSIELYPPKTPEGVDKLKQRLGEIAAHRPDYISVTYGAGGGTRATTREVCAYIKQELAVEAMAHLTCVAHSRGEIAELLAALKHEGIENIMALRGDPPVGQARFVPPEDGFAYATELVRAIRAAGDFGIGVAGYPEGHVEAPDYATSLRHLVEKIEAGADFVVSQLFMDNADFLRWRDDLHRAGVRVPIAAGIMPPLSARQIVGFAAKCGARVPDALRVGLERFDEHPESAAAFGLHFALRQIEGLLREGVAGIHLYALNRLESIRAVGALVSEQRRA